MAHAPTVTPHTPAFFRRALRWLLPVSIFLLIQLIGFSGLFPSGQKAFSSDEAYVHLSVVRQAMDGFGYSLTPGTPLSPTQDGLLHMVLLGLVPIFSDPEMALWFLQGACGMGILLLSIRLAGLLMPLNAMRVATGVAVALAPTTHAMVFSGTGMALSTLLFLLAVLLHIEGIHARRGSLSAVSAIALGLAGLVQPIMAAWWPVFWGHALFTRSPGGSRVPIRLLLVQGLAGVAVVGMVLWPFVDQHMTLLGVPWPGSFEAGWYQVAGPHTSHMGGGLQLFFQTGNLNGPVTWLLWIVSLAAVFWPSSAFRERKGFGLVVLAPIFALLLALLFYPVLGWNGGESVILAAWALQPIVWAYTIFRGWDLLSRYVTLPPVLASRPALSGLAAASLCFALLLIIPFTSFLKEERMRLEQVSAERSELAKAVDALPANQPVWSDQPGWIAWQSARPVADLSAIRSPGFLTWMETRGELAETRVQKDVRQLRPALVVLYSPAFQPQADATQTAGRKLGLDIQFIRAFE